MKSTLAYYTLLLYLTVIIKPVIPIISDFYSHQFNETEHMIKVHMVYGHNHLQHDLSNSTEKESDKTSGNVKVDDQFQVYLSGETSYKCLAAVESIPSYAQLKLTKPSFICLSQQGPPPKFS